MYFLWNFCCCLPFYIWVILLGEALWNRPPWLGTIVTMCILWQEVLVRNTELISQPPQPEEFRKGPKETPPVQPPPWILTGIPLSWPRCSPPGRTLSQNDWLKTTHHQKTRDWEPRDRAVLLGSLTLLLSAPVPFPNKISCLVSTCLLGQFISEC